MRFGPVPLAEALGAISAHSHRLADRLIRKGAVLDAEAIASLRRAGFSQIVAARLDPEDVAENDCADRLAAPFAAGSFLSRSPATTGRVNILADTPGVLRVDAARIDAVNAVDEAMTVGTLPDYAVVAARDIVATVKIIPFAVPAARLEHAAACARGDGPLLSLHPFRPLRVGLVATELPNARDSVTQKAIEVTQARVAALSGRVLSPRRCPHEEEAIAAALAGLLAEGAELLLLIGASAVVDRRDVGPAAIVRAGGAIEHFGMPVDPGNLICLGRIGACPAVILPGCARSPRLNGIDFILSRLFAGLSIGRAEIVRMGVGGLLVEAEQRPEPRGLPAAPRIAAIVLAAGRSTRMGRSNKLLLPDQAGRAMIARTVEAALASRARPVIVVTGHQAEDIRQALAGRPVRFVHGDEYALGLAASLKAGLAAVPEECAAAMICLGDMPLVPAAMLDRLIAAYDRDAGRLIVEPRHRGQPGNPMIWDRQFFPAILRLSGDRGARALLTDTAVARHVAPVEADTDAVLRDFDTPETLALLGTASDG